MKQVILACTTLLLSAALASAEPLGSEDGAAEEMAACSAATNNGCSCSGTQACDKWRGGASVTCVTHTPNSTDITKCDDDPNGNGECSCRTQSYPWPPENEQAQLLEEH